MENILGSVEQINNEFEKLCRKSKVVGANVALFNGEEILYSYNYGYINKSSKLKSTNDSLYMIGSNTKILTALGILKMMKNELVSLDDDIRKFIPEFGIKSFFEYDKITIENLLMHRSGIISDLFHLIVDPTRDYHEVVEELKNTYLTSIPGQMFSYSNVGYTLLGIIIERVSGLEYAKFIEKEIARPLGIDIHFLKNDEEKRPFLSRLSQNYDKKGNAVADYVSTMIPAGSNTYMSMSDLVKLGQMFLRKDSTIAKTETLLSMEKLNVPEPVDNELLNVGYGLIHNQYDLGENAPRILGHGGDTTCHHSVFNYIPELNIGVAVMTNSEQAVGLSRSLGLNILIKYLKTKGIMLNSHSDRYNYIKSDCNRYIGKFATTMGVYDIQKNAKGELVSRISGLNVKLTPCDDGYLHCRPNGIVSKLPPIKRAITGLRFKLIDYCGSEVMTIEQSAENYKTRGIIGCRYSETKIPESFQNACGSYETANQKFRKLCRKCLLVNDNGILKLKIDALNTKVITCLNVVDDEIAIIQGFGRNACQTVRISRRDNKTYLTYSGIIFKKKK